MRKELNAIQKTTRIKWARFFGEMRGHPDLPEDDDISAPSKNGDYLFYNKETNEFEAYFGDGTMLFVAPAAGMTDIANFVLSMATKYNLKNEVSL